MSGFLAPLNDWFPCVVKHEAGFSHVPDAVAFWDVQRTGHRQAVDQDLARGQTFKAAEIEHGHVHRGVAGVAHPQFNAHRAAGRQFDALGVAGEGIGKPDVHAVDLVEALGNEIHLLLVVRKPIAVVVLGAVVVEVDDAHPDVRRIAFLDTFDLDHEGNIEASACGNLNLNDGLILVVDEAGGPFAWRLVHDHATEGGVHVPLVFDGDGETQPSVDLAALIRHGCVEIHAVRFGHRSLNRGFIVRGSTRIWQHADDNLHLFGGQGIHRHGDRHRHVSASVRGVLGPKRNGADVEGHRPSTWRCTGADSEAVGTVAGVGDADRGRAGTARLDVGHHALWNGHRGALGLSKGDAQFCLTGHRATVSALNDYRGHRISIKGVVWLDVERKGAFIGGGVVRKQPGGSPVDADPVRLWAGPCNVDVPLGVAGVLEGDLNLALLARIDTDAGLGEAGLTGAKFGHFEGNFLRVAGVLRGVVLHRRRDVPAEGLCVLTVGHGGGHDHRLRLLAGDAHR